MAHTTLGICLAVVLLSILFTRPRKTLRLPPGPRPKPIIGNFLDLPPNGQPEFQHWLKHKDKYGPVTSVTVMGTTIVVIHDLPTARLLLEKKAAVTSGRPYFEFAQSLCGLDEILALRQPDDQWRRRRRFLQKGIGSSDQYGHMMEAETTQLLAQILDKPTDLVRNLHTVTGAVILNMTYGYAIDRTKADPLVTLVEQMMLNFSAATVPLTWLVDAIPALSRLPDWFPGTAFKRTARQWKNVNLAMADIPYNFVRKQMAQGCHNASYTSDILQSTSESPDQSLTAEQENDIKWSAASLYSGGSDTIVGTLTSFFLAMIMYPDVQKQARDEIDQVTGGTRLPCLADRESLPYISRVVSETLRWNPIAPMGIAHVAEEDIPLDSYTIPEGAYLLPAIWWFCHDPERFKDPEVFDPSRYCEPRNEPDLKAVPFGFGRRSCPGRAFAEAETFLAIAQTLAVFQIKAGVNEDGTRDHPELQPMPGIICHPREFKYEISPRSEAHVDLIRSCRSKVPYRDGDVAWLDMADCNLGEGMRG